MHRAIGIVMLANAALFVFGAVQHAGLSLGPFHEPLIIPASIVESLCALALIWGAVSVLGDSRIAFVAAVSANLIPIAGVIVGMVALGLGRGPRTWTNDMYHRVMLSLSGAALVLIIIGRKAFSH